MKNENSRLTIGILVNNYYDKYTYAIWKGVKKAVDECEGKVLCFVGGSLNNPFFNNSQKNAVFDLVNTNNVDGILVVSSSIGTYIDLPRLTDFIKSFDPIPLISIGGPIHDFPSVFVDNKSGMEELLIHLIKDHGYKDIAFVRGPQTNKDAQIRYNTYIDVLTHYNIPINPELIISSTRGFHGNFGRSAINQLMDERKVHFDVLVASNDYVALNAIKELKRRGIDVPKEIAVVGFDDIPDCQNIRHPLTTVNQPTFEVGYQAAYSLFSLLRGEQISMEKIFESTLVIRGTCGCEDISREIENKNISILRNKNLLDAQEGISTELFIKAIVDTINYECKELIEISQLREWALLLHGAFIEDLKKGTEEKFLTVLKGIINDTLQNQVRILSWNTIIFYIFNTIVYKCEDEQMPVINHIFINAINLIQSTILNRLEYPILRANEFIRSISGLRKMILKVFRLSDLEEVICKQFPHFGIKSCYISIYEKEEKRKQVENTRMLIAYKNGKCLPIDDIESSFIPEQLFPEMIRKIEDDNSFLVYSLSDKQDLLGYVIYTIESIEMQQTGIDTDMDNMCEFLSLEISNAIVSILLYNQVWKQTHTLIDHIKEEPETENDIKYFQYPQEESKEYFRRLLLFMDKEKPYVDEELSLPMLAEQLDISRNYLSYIINKFSGVNFYDFINSYRIERAKYYLKKEAKEKINMLKITYDSGFKSKSTFYKTFKKYTNVTPTEFRNEYMAAKKIQDTAM
ncbi:MAG: substrate-binding domain-containing protein [Spirochaetales bacterium]|nr:substrate-binding domain-containing protein [Spirochaetales bacterium]